MENRKLTKEEIVKHIREISNIILEEIDRLEAIYNYYKKKYRKYYFLCCSKNKQEMKEKKDLAKDTFITKRDLAMEFLLENWVNGGSEILNEWNKKKEEILITNL